MTPIMITEIALMAALTTAVIASAFRRRKGHGISIVIPFRCTDPNNQRVKNLHWLKRYWKSQLPGAELIIGEDPMTDMPFSKSVAVNNGVAKAKGDVLVIVDADGFIPAKSVLHCAEEIRDARKRGQNLWFVPYRKFYRLTELASRCLLQSSPKKPFEFPNPITPECILGDAQDPNVGHWYGAMIQICPREAWDIVGGWDERFRGWGNEDHAAMRAMDTLFGLHKTLPGAVLHVWHPQIGPQGEKPQVHWKERMWAGQEDPGANDKLGNRYYGAYRNPEKMRKLLEEGRREAKNPHTRPSQQSNISHRRSM